MKAKAHFTTPIFVLHIDKHNLSVTCCPQSAVSFPSSLLSVSLHLGLHRSLLQLQNSVFFHVYSASSGPIPVVTSYLCITHLFLIISSHIFQFSLLCRPPSLHSFLVPRLKRFTSPLSPCPGALPPFDTILIFLSIFLHLFFFYPSSLSCCPATSRIPPSLRPLSPPFLSPCPPAEIKLCRHEPGPTTSPTEAQPHGPKKTDLEKQDKVHQNCSGFTAPWAVYIFGYHFTFLHSPCPAPPSLSVFLSPSFCFAPSLFLCVFFTGTHCRSLDSEASLQ